MATMALRGLTRLYVYIVWPLEINMAHHVLFQGPCRPSTLKLGWYTRGGVQQEGTPTHCRFGGSTTLKHTVRQFGFEKLDDEHFYHIFFPYGW
jgi:hypothetical protein